jgi:hypothetical protein
MMNLKISVMTGILLPTIYSFDCDTLCYYDNRTATPQTGEIYVQTNIYK